MDLHICAVDELDEFSDPIFGFSSSDLNYLEQLTSDSEWVWKIVKESTTVGVGVTVFKKKRMYAKYFQLNAGEAFITRVQVLPEFRGQSIMPRAIGELCSMVEQQRSVSKIFVDIATQNRSSMRAFAKSGMQLTDSGLVRFRIFGFDIVLPFGKLRSRFGSQ